MQAHPSDPEAVRSHLCALVEQRYGGLSRDALRRAAREAGIEYTTLARYFGVYTNGRQTRRLQASTLRSLLEVLQADPPARPGGRAHEQIDLWPVLVRPEPEAFLPDPITRLNELMAHVRSLPYEVRVRACRAAVSAVLASVADMGESVPDDSYELLRQMDSLQRDARHLKVG